MEIFPVDFFFLWVPLRTEANTQMHENNQKKKKGKEKIGKERKTTSFCVLQEKDAQFMFGMVLYSLDRLYRAVERHAKATGEWLW